MKVTYDSYLSPIGLIYIVMDDIGVRKVVMTEDHWHAFKVEFGEITQDRERCREAVQELEEYFSGERIAFSVPLHIIGTEFSQKVWKALLEIPCGETRDYSMIGKSIGNPKASRAVGQANRRNPLPIFIPCHRVIGKNGAMTGYLGDHTNIKQWLLQLEKRDANG